MQQKLEEYRNKNDGNNPEWLKNWADSMNGNLPHIASGQGYFIELGKIAKRVRNIYLHYIVCIAIIHNILSFRNVDYIFV